MGRGEGQRERGRGSWLPFGGSGFWVWVVVWVSCMDLGPPSEWMTGFGFGGIRSGLGECLGLGVSR